MSVQVASGHVAVFPVMTGFKARVAREMKASGSAGATGFSGMFKGVGQKVGALLGRETKGGFAKVTADMGSAGMQQLTRDVAAAAAALSKARLTHQDTAGKVRVAEAKLAEALEKYPAGSSQVVAAEERLEAARRRHAAASDHLAATWGRLKSAQEALKSVTDAAARANQTLLTRLTGLAGKARSAWSSLAAGTTSTNILTRGLSAMVQGLTTGAANIGTFGAAARTGLASAVSTITAPLAKLGSTIAAPFARIGSTIAAPFQKLGGVIGATLGPVGAAVGTLGAKLGPAIGRGVASMVSTFTSGVKSMVSAAARAATAITQKLADTLRGPATAAVGAAAAGIGFAFTKGFGRLTSIDTAQAKLRGLGHDGTAIADIMKSANESVRGTAFGLDAAATVAAGAVAANIAPGEGLTRVLKVVANTAAAAGTDMGEMGSIFNKVAAAQRADTEQINQLADRGIPIWQKLAEQYGVNMTELRKMVSDGKVSFDDFTQAAEAASGTVASEMGKTIPGALSNLRASLGRIGANILGGTDGVGGIYSKLGPLIQAITGSLGPVEGAAKRLGDTIGANLGPILDRITEAIRNFGTEGDGLKTKLMGLLPVIGPVGGALLALGSGGLAGLLGKIPLLSSMLPGLSAAFRVLGGPIGLIIGAFAGLVATSPQLQALLGQLVSGALTMLMELVQILSPHIATLGALFQSIAAQVLPILIPLVTQLVETFLSLLPIFLQLIEAILPPIMELFAALAPLIVQVIGVVAGLVAAILPLLPPLLQLIAAILPPIIRLFAQILPPVIALASAIIDRLVPVINGLIGFLSGLINFVLGVFTGNWSGAWAGVKEMFSGFVQGVGSLIKGVLLVFFRDIPAAIKGVFAGAGSWLAAAGRHIIEGLLNGLRAAFERVKSFVSGIGSWIAANKGPKAYDLALLQPAGKWIMTGFHESLRDEFADVERDVKAMGRRLAAAVDATTSGGDLGLPGVSAAVERGGSRVHIDKVINPIAEPSTVTVNKELQRVAALTGRTS